MNLAAVRRGLAVQGVTPAAAVPDSSSGRMEEACIRLAKLMEDATLQVIAVGQPQPWPGSLAYLDGTQRSEVVGYVGSSPIVIAEIAAAVRERRDRVIRTVLEERRWVAMGRDAALVRASEALRSMELVILPDDDPPHPVRDLVNAARALDHRRGALELQLGDQYRSRSDGWLIADGSLSESPRWAADPRMVGISKSHSVLPFDGEDLERYLRLPVAHRSSVYSPETRSLAPVRAWGLRLHDWEGKDLLHGLVRVEVSPANGISAQADAISRWILAERAPISAPDRRWDRLLYGIYSVEQYLKSRTV
jgi:hypothetical protein